MLTFNEVEFRKRWDREEKMMTEVALCLDAVFKLQEEIKILNDKIIYILSKLQELTQEKTKLTGQENQSQ